MLLLLLQGRIDLRTLAGARMVTECTSLLLAGIVVLSMLGINISALLLPAGVVLAIASRDLLQNFIAGTHTCTGVTRQHQPAGGSQGVHIWYTGACTG